MNNDAQSLSPNEPAELLLLLVPVLPVPAPGGDMCLKQICVTKPAVEDDRDAEDDEDEEMNELMQGHTLHLPLELQDWPYLHNEIGKVLDKEKKMCHLPYSQVSESFGMSGWYSWALSA
jgi:hypothetical protein